VPVKASQRIEEIMEEEHIAMGSRTREFLRHLAKIEEIEARLGREDLDKEEMEALVTLCHQILNEVQELHITSYLEDAYVYRRAQP
jgi:DNA phosphorothioation-dependent restriction protein DptG